MTPDAQPPPSHSFSPQLLIGCGGWAYFPLETERLRQYAARFNIVEVNSTFYHIPTITQVKTWRQQVPDTFKFTIKSHRTITHEAKLKLIPKTITNLSRMIAICQTLSSPYLVFQCPPSFQGNQQSIGAIDNFLNEFPTDHVTPLIEVRGTTWNTPTNRGSLQKTLRKHGAYLVEDLSRVKPEQTNILYSRIFGHGTFNRWEFTDNELQSMIQLVSRSTRILAVLVFHSIRMYEAAARSKYYLDRGHFPEIPLFSQDRVNKTIQSLTFPISTQSLHEQIGWRVITIAADEQIHLQDVIRHMPNTRYNSPFELQNAINKAVTNLPSNT